MYMITFMEKFTIIFATLCPATLHRNYISYLYCVKQWQENDYKEESCLLTTGKMVVMLVAITFFNYLTYAYLLYSI